MAWICSSARRAASTRLLAPAPPVSLSRPPRSFLSATEARPYWAAHLPAEIRRRLGIRTGSQLEVKVVDNAINLRPATVIPEEDRWAYTPEALASLRRALAAGRVPRRAGRVSRRRRPKQ
ncbi:MAG: AbrB/MazE/SpoVT family DNA-binding domain-containing protein [Chloroflexi bacterium]|nr:MAG: AbrB/MazE/SpoVT family DNA-binding domain-containing protein [Chloroflexota bacterium]